MILYVKIWGLVAEITITAKFETVIFFNFKPMSKWTGDEFQKKPVTIMRKGVQEFFKIVSEPKYKAGRVIERAQCKMDFPICALLLQISTKPYKITKISWP